MNLVIFLGMIDRVFGNFHGQILLGNDGLAAQARLGLQTPSTVEQVLLLLLDLVQTGVALAHDDVTGRASATHITGVLNGNVVIQQRLANARARRGADGCPLWAEFGMGQNGNRGHSAVSKIKKTSREIVPEKF